MSVSTASIQGKVTGIIMPPNLIRDVVDKTAQFVAKHGKTFEKRILDSEEGKTPKFHFMRPFDPYYAYYEFKIQEFENVKYVQPAQAASSAKPQQADKPATQSQSSVKPNTLPASKPSAGSTIEKSKFVSPLARFAAIKPTLPPPPFEFLSSFQEIQISVKRPSQQDLDVIRLTAQYTAVNGRVFLAGLAARESRNPMFDFLKPTHLYFGIFTAFVEQYSRVLRPPPQLKDFMGRLSKYKSTNETSADDDATGKLSILQRAAYRHEWHQLELVSRAEAESNEKKKIIVEERRVDWNVFDIVEVIEFDENEMLNEVDVQDMKIHDDGGDARQERRQGQFADDDDDEPAVSYQASRDRQYNRQMPMVSMNDSDDIRLVGNYVPQESSSSSSRETANLMVMDTSSNSLIPLADLASHIRSSTVDIDTMEKERARAAASRGPTKRVFETGDVIASQLKRMVKRRGEDSDAMSDVGLVSSRSRTSDYDCVHVYVKLRNQVRDVLVNLDDDAGQFKSQVAEAFQLKSLDFKVKHVDRNLLSSEVDTLRSCGVTRDAILDIELN